MSPLTTAHGGETLPVHQLLCQSAPDYLRAFGPAMPGRHRQVLHKILRCRTGALGGQLFRCPDCPAFHYRYHSCNDRHCPLCGQTDADAWLQHQRDRLLLPVPYFLVTFTVPEELRAFLRSHPQIGLDLLFTASAGALQDLAANPRRLGAQLGMLGVLHTWSRTLIFHPHVHYLIPGGGLTADGTQWRPVRNQFLLHHQALGQRCRTLFQGQLRKHYPALFHHVPSKVWRRPWNVGCKAAGSGEHALRYLSRYVFKTATGNRTLHLLPEGKVRWPYRDSKTGQWTSVKFQPPEFLRRFLQHVLPPHFARVRTFGWLHPAAKIRLNRVRALLGKPPRLTPTEQQVWNGTSDPEHIVELQTPGTSRLPAGCPPPLCPRCRQTMRLVASWRSAPLGFLPNRPP